MTISEKLNRRHDKGGMKLKIGMDDEKRIWVDYYVCDDAGVIFPWGEPDAFPVSETLEALELYYTILENLNITSKEYPLYKERILADIKGI